MKDWILEWLFVFAHCTRAQVLVVIGLVLSLTVFVAGKLIVADFEINGTFAPLTKVLREYLSDRYTGVSLGILVVAFAGAIRRVRKERDRLLNQ